VKVHGASSLPWVRGFEPPKAFVRAQVVVRPSDEGEGADHADGSEGLEHQALDLESTSLLPMTDREPQTQTTELIAEQLDPVWEETFVFKVNREMLDLDFGKDQFLLLQVVQTSEEEGEEVCGEWGQSIRTLYKKHPKEKINMQRKALTLRKEPPFSSLDVSLGFEGDWIHVTELRDLEIDEQFLKYWREFGKRNAEFFQKVTDANAKKRETRLAQEREQKEARYMN